MHWILVKAILPALASPMLAVVSTPCPLPELGFTLNIPAATLASGDGHIPLNITGFSAASSYVAFAQGSSDTRQTDFVVYPVKKGVSDTAAGVQDIKMKAVVRCAKLKLDHTDPVELDTTAPDTSHSGLFMFQLSVDTQTKGHLHRVHGIEALLGRSRSPTTSSGPPPRVVRMYTAHAILACLAWTFVFPVGGILIRLCSFRGLIWTHAILQMSGFCMYTAAVGLGIELSISPKHWRMGNKHVIIGLMIYILFLFQAATGYIHHLMFNRYGSRTAWSHVHLWVGRLCIMLGMINAGFGFQITHKKWSRWEVCLYTACAVFMWIAYVASAVYGEARKLHKSKEAELTTGNESSGEELEVHNSKA